MKIFKKSYDWANIDDMHMDINMIHKAIHNSTIKESTFIGVDRVLNVRNPGDKEWDSYDYIAPPQK